MFSLFVSDVFSFSETFAQCTFHFQGALTHHCSRLQDMVSPQNVVQGEKAIKKNFTKRLESCTFRRD